MLEVPRVNKKIDKASIVKILNEELKKADEEYKKKMDKILKRDYTLREQQSSERSVITASKQFGKGFSISITSDHSSSSSSGYSNPCISRGPPLSTTEHVRSPLLAHSPDLIDPHLTRNLKKSLMTRSRDYEKSPGGEKRERKKGSRSSSLIQAKSEKNQFGIFYTGNEAMLKRALQGAGLNSSADKLAVCKAAARGGNRDMFNKAWTCNSNFLTTDEKYEICKAAVAGKSMRIFEAVWNSSGWSFTSRQKFGICKSAVRHRMLEILNAAKIPFSLLQKQELKDNCRGDLSMLSKTIATVY